jgi:hypothetical protein
MASSLKDFALLIDEEIYKNILLTLLKETNEYIRIPLIDNIVTLKDHIRMTNLQDFIYTVFTKFSSDKSWRVRLTVIDKVPNL